MTFQIVINLIISGLWMFLSESYTLGSFLFGYLLGAGLLLLLNRFFTGPFYLQRIYRLLILFIIFIRELILSNLEIVKYVYKKDLNIEPGIFAMPIEVEKDWEITLLANLITLTPGTLTVAISDDQKQLFIHALDIDTKEESINDIKNTFEKAIMEVTK
ncbi:MAG TPA: Na+/H+ antiporter subunit E [Pseudogracilibacillus sp.]|nr:Na+/H+ antiporter subunit E [Pseudogracilibacillus sp.]